MSLSAHNKPKFLLDENVRKEVGMFLISRGFDVITTPKGVANGKLADLAKTEKRIIVTNDSDFTDAYVYPKKKIFSVIWLRIPQNDPDSMIRELYSLLEKTKTEDFEGKIIILKEKEFEMSDIQ